MQDQEDKPEPFDLSERYWLAKPFYSDDYASCVMGLVSTNTKLWGNSRVGSAMWKAYNVYHNIEGDAQVPAVYLQEGGEDGELILARINMYRNLVRHMLALAASQRPAWDPQARTTDSEAAKQVALVRNLLDFVMSAKGLEKKLYEQAESGFVLACAYMALGWDPTAGREASGDLWARVLMPWEVVHEHTRDYEDVKWWIFSQYENRWDHVARLAETDPERAEKLANLPSDELTADTVNQIGSVRSPDRVQLWYVYAMPSAALPQGRMSIVASGDVVIFDGPYPYGDAKPIIRMAPNTFLGTSEPYADSWSLLSVNDAYNDVLSCILTRIDAFGIPNVTQPQGSEMEAEDVGGLRMLTHPVGAEKPALLDLLQIGSELPNMLSLLEKIGENLSGINSVSRGNPAENIKSGAMAALVQSMAIQYNSALERAVNQAAEEVGTSIVRIYQAMASEDQMISICGEDQAWTAAVFNKEAIKDIQRVSVKTVSALQKTTGFRLEMAQQLLQNGLISTPQEYQLAANTGNVEPLFAGAVNSLTSIKAENEGMSRGEPAHAFLWENHELHIREHLKQVDARMKQNAPVLQLYNEHVKEHYDLWVQMSREMPDALAAIGLKPLPQAQMVGQQAAAMEGMAPGGAQPGPNPVKEPETEQPKGRAGRPPNQGSEPGAAANLPSPAKNPMTGQAPV